MVLDSMSFPITLWGKMTVIPTKYFWDLDSYPSSSQTGHVTLLVLIYSCLKWGDNGESYVLQVCFLESLRVEGKRVGVALYPCCRRSTLLVSVFYLGFQEWLKAQAVEPEYLNLQTQMQLSHFLAVCLWAGDLIFLCPSFLTCEWGWYWYPLIVTDL